MYVMLEKCKQYLLYIIMQGGNCKKCGDLCSIPGLGKSPGEGKGYPCQYSGLENSMNLVVYGVANRNSDREYTITGLQAELHNKT